MVSDVKINKRYLAHSEVVDWNKPEIRKLAGQLQDPMDSLVTARNCFEWVRDEIRHSMDAGLSQVTCSASEVLQHGHGFCYAKSHLLTALLRANGIPAGFSYQRLSDDLSGFCLHGFNGLYLQDMGWYRVDARGNKPGVDAQFNPPQEQLAFTNHLPGEVDYGIILSEPWPTVIHALREISSVQELATRLPNKLMMG